MDAASDHRAHAQGVRRWRKRFGWASIVFFCLFSGMLVYMPWSLDFPADHAPPPFKEHAPPPFKEMETLSGGPRFQKIDAATLTADANIREGPSTNTPLVGMIPSGAQLTVTGRMEDYDWHYDWYQVRLRDGTTGYFLGKLIPPEGAWLLAPAHTVPPDVPP
jgi:hypothetical protein